MAATAKQSDAVGLAGITVLIGICFTAASAAEVGVVQYNIVNSIDKAQLANTLQSLEGISEATREQVNALLIREQSED